MTRRRDAHDAQRRMEHAVEDELSLREAGPLVRPYGDTTGDGMVQVSFTLPLPHDKRAEGAALQLAAKMGLEPALLVHAKAMGPDFTFFVVYGSVTHLVDVRDVEVVEREFPLLTSKEINAEIKKRLRRKLVVVGACIGTDAHTVGIDAILNIKGFAGEKGLEYYREMTVVNLGAQVLVPDLVNTAREVRADAVLVSQVVTQKDAHIHNTTAMSAAFREAFPAGQVPLLVVGGPRFEEGSRRRPRRRPRLRPRHDPRRGRLLPRARARHGPHRSPTREEPSDDRAPRSACTVTHRRYVPYSHAHYAGNLVDGAYSLAAFGDVATELCIRTDGDEGLFASYSDVQFLAPVRAGDVIEIEATLVRVGTRSREMDFEVRVVGRGHPGARRVRRRRASTRPSSRPPPEGSSWCPQPGDLPWARAHARSGMPRARLPPSPPGCACGSPSRTPTSGGSHPWASRCSPAATLTAGAPPRGRARPARRAGLLRARAVVVGRLRRGAAVVRAGDARGAVRRRDVGGRRVRRARGSPPPGAPARPTCSCPSAGSSRSGPAAPPPTAGSRGRGWRSARPTARWPTSPGGSARRG